MTRRHHGSCCPRRCRSSLPGIVGAVLGIVALMGVPASAFMRWNGGGEQMFLNLSGGMTWDSNIFGSAGGGSDLISQVSAGLEYQRRVGLISADASMLLASAQFADHTDENYLNPNLRVELSKETGRATGSLNLNSARESRADSNANLRTESWNHAASLLWKYPVIERYSLSGHFDYARQDYTNNAALVDLSSYAAAIDLFYVYTSARDLMAGYLIRTNESSTGETYTDHAFTGGIAGQILPKINGNVRVGYSLRETEAGGADASWTSSGSATWTATERLKVTAQVSKDFSITSTGVSVNTLYTALDAHFAIVSSTTVFAGVSFASSDFLGDPGNDREDVNFGASAGLTRTFAWGLSANLSWSYSQNWSTLDFSDFERQSAALTLSYRY